MKTYPGFFVQANGIKIHFYRSTPPGGGPALVLIHGLTDNGMCWGRVAEALDDTYDLIMPDLRGHGLSEKPAAGYALEDRAADVAGLIDALALDRPVLMGHSLGGETVMAVSALYPERVRAVILEDPAWFNGESTKEGWESRARTWLADLLHQQELEREMLIAECSQQNPGWNTDDISVWADAKRQMSGESLVGILTSMGSGWQDLVQKASCPILLVTASHSRGGITTPEMVEEASRLWKQGAEAHIEGAGHSIHREQFELYVEKVKAFLRSVA